MEKRICRKETGHQKEHGFERDCGTRVLGFGTFKKSGKSEEETLAVNEDDRQPLRGGSSSEAASRRTTIGASFVCSQQI